MEEEERKKEKEYQEWQASGPGSVFPPDTLDIRDRSFALAVEPQHPPMGPIGLESYRPAWAHLLFLQPHSHKKKMFPQLPWEDFPWKHQEDAVFRMRLDKKREAGFSPSEILKELLRSQGDRTTHEHRSSERGGGWGTVWTTHPWTDCSKAGVQRGS